MEIIKVGRYRLGKCTKGYVILCEQEGCLNTPKCQRHKIDKRSYKYCQVDSCKSQASYGYEWNKALWCQPHAPKDCIDVKHRRCRKKYCDTQARFGYPGGKAVYCSSHQKDGMEDSYAIWCELCKTHAIFGYPDGKRTHCSSHKKEGMEDLTAIWCELCKTHASFGYEWQKPLRCEKHKTDEMENVVDKRCIEPNCKTRPTFGVEAGVGVFCRAHAPEDYFDVISRKCCADGCNQQPSFGEVGGPALYCAKHKERHMKNNISKKCDFPCEVRPTFGYPNTTATRCDTHKLEGMINLKDALCCYEDCTKLAAYGYPGGEKIFCASHKKEDMVDLKRDICIEDNCLSRAAYGYFGEKAILCGPHKRPDTIDLVHSRCCYEGCDSLSSYCYLFTAQKLYCQEHSTSNTYSYDKRYPICTFAGCNKDAIYIDDMDTFIYPIRCNDHKLPTDIQLILRPCKQCGVKVYFPSNHEICMDCGKYKDKKPRHFKENIIYNMLKINNILFVHDRLISVHGSKYRPDFLTKCQFGYLIIEIDEYQHSKHDKNKELLRMQVIYQDIQSTHGKSQVLFIRYNPDNYNGGIKFKSKQRQDHLYKIIKYLLPAESIPTDLGVLYLYYNGFKDDACVLPLETDVQINISPDYIEEDDHDIIDEVIDDDEDD